MAASKHIHDEGWATAALASPALVSGPGPEHLASTEPPPSRPDPADANADPMGLMMMADHLMDTIGRLGPDFRYQYISSACERLFGEPAAALIGRHAAEFVHPEDVAMVEAFARHPDRYSSMQGGVTYRLIRPDGKMLWAETTGRALGPDHPQYAHHHMVVHRDISDRVAFEQQLMEMANRDGLTNLANRRAFDTALEREWSRTLVEGAPLSLLLGDVDHFKAFNDRYGHQVGDDCLRAVAKAISGALEQTTDVAARYGGEEIAVILPNVDSSDACRLAEKFRRAVEDLAIPHQDSAAEAKRVSISIGVATMAGRVMNTPPAEPINNVVPPVVFTAESGTLAFASLLQAADAALYRAKHAGRNRICTTLLV